MDITRKNLHEWSSEIKSAIDNATFLAIDAELTGLNLPGYSIHAFETPGERYNRTREAVNKFLVIQYGVAVFTHDTNSDRYTVRVFNFYVFPRPFARQAPDVRFTCQSSCLDFLTTQGFDFNKAIKDGISYLLPSDEDRLRSLLHEKHAKQDSQAHNHHVPHGAPGGPPDGTGVPFSSPAFTSPQTEGVPINKGPCVIPDDHQPFIDAICDSIQEFLVSGDAELHLDPCNGYLRKLTFQSLAQRFTGIHLASCTDKKRQRYILVTKAASPEEMKERELAKREAEFKEVEDAVGFSAIIKHISQSGKLIVGHNMLLDLMHMIDKFCHPLPEDYEEFKLLATSLFPRVLDTKHMASSMPFKENISNTSLGDLYKSLHQFPFTMPKTEQADEKLCYSDDSSKEHEAGYDAYITGLSFIAMANYLGHGDETVLPSTPSVTTYYNKLFLMRMQDSPYMHLSGEDVSPPRDHVFHLTFPPEWKSSDISQLFSPFGSVYIGWVDESSAYISLNRRENAELIMKSLPNTSYYQIHRYHDYHRRRRSLETPTRPPPGGYSLSGAATEKRKSSPIADVDLPRRKQRRSSRGSSPFNKIPTIPEEEEASEPQTHSDGVTPIINRKRRLPGETREDGELDTDTTDCDDGGEGDHSNHDNRSNDNIGEPVRRKKLKTESSTTDKSVPPKPAETTIFDVPDTW